MLRGGPSARATKPRSKSPDAWHDYIHDPTVADSICDRVIHNAHGVALKGESRRKEKPTKN